MSNILVCKNYKITDHTKWWDDRSAESNLAENYTEMEKILVASAEKHLQDLDSVHVFRGEADNIRDVFRTNFYEIHDLWKQGHNILYCDLDVVFTNSAKFFGEFDKFTMFNFTDPVKTTDDHYELEFPYYFNCGIRYYPQDMSEEVWKQGFQMLENWNPDRWDCEQIIYNAMFWGQANLEPEKVYKPNLAYQMLFDCRSSHGNDTNKKFNQIDLTEASVVHVHGSRGSESRLDLMQALSDGNLDIREEVLYL